MEKTTYKSKVDTWLWTLIFAIFLFGIAICLSAPLGWIGLITLLPGIALVVDIIKNTDYTIIGDKLNIRSGVLMRYQYDIHKITTIEDTKTPHSSPALSFDRIALKQDNRTLIIISPKQKEAFIAHMQRINPAITHTS